MLERVRYVNHINESINFGQNGIFMKSRDLHDYSWSPITKNDKISAFKRSVQKRTLPVTIFCATPSEGVAKSNQLMEIVEKDILVNMPGKLIVGGTVETVEGIICNDSE